MRRLLLASRGLGALEVLELEPGGRAVYVPTAANRCRHEPWVRELPTALADHGLEVDVLDLEASSRRVVAATLRGADLVAVGGGDPFHLLRHALLVRFGAALADALARGSAYLGVSAGAMVVGPDLRPVAVPSPFDPPRGMPLTGLRIVDRLVLPHDGEPERSAFNEEATRRFPEIDIVRITDDQAVLVEGDRWRVIPSITRARAATTTGRRRSPRR